jgi:hypothetical protein
MVTKYNKKEELLTQILSLHEVLYKETDVSEEHIASIFSVVKPPTKLHPIHSIYGI